MQPTEIQVERSLAALRSDPAGDGPSPPGPTAVAAPAVGSAALERIPAPDPGEPEVPIGLAERLSALPPVRPDRLADAKVRLERGELPEADDLARRVVGRLVCDRLR